MIIYFDNNKIAYGSLETIQNFGFSCIAQVDKEIWDNFKADEVGISWDIVDGVFQDLRGSDGFKAKAQDEENKIKKSELQAKIDELDKRRIRAICEPSIKDSVTGQSWLEYYTEYIVSLREEISAL